MAAAHAAALDLVALVILGADAVAEQVIRFDVQARNLTAAELEAARLRKLPIHCQTMQRRSRVNPNELVFSDVEELSREMLDKTVAEYRAAGWRESGTYFVRNAK